MPGTAATLVRAAIVGGVAAATFRMMVSRFLCCQGEDGFAWSATYVQLLTASILAASLLVQPGWRRHPRRALLGGLALFAASTAIALAARPALASGLDRSLQIDLRTAAVFVAVTLAAMAELWVLGRWRGRRRRRPL